MNRSRIISLGLFSFFYLALLQSFQALGHHSRSGFLLDETIEIEGTITEITWRNPHVYLVINSTEQGSQSEEWTLESHSVSGLERNGWSRDALKLGDHVVVVANPSRTQGIRLALLDSVRRDDETFLYSFQQAVLPTDQRDDSESVTLEPSTDFSGTWTRYSGLPRAEDLRRMLVSNFETPWADMALTQRGQELTEDYDANTDPYFDCVPMALPRIIDWPFPRLWTRTESEIRITQDTTGQVRVIHLNGPWQPPNDYELTELGYSVGHFESDNTLVVETHAFRAMPWGIVRGINSSDQMIVTERYKLVDGGLRMDYSYTIEDPVFLREPFTLRKMTMKVPDYAFSSEVCDEETSRRHLQFEAAFAGP